MQVREAQLAQFNYILVVGAQEAETGNVSPLYLVTFFLLLHAVYLYQYHPIPVSPSDIDARKIDLIPCCLTWIPCVLQICVRVRDNADLATMSVDGFITRLKEEIVAFR